MTEYITIKNWTGKGRLLVSKDPMLIQEGDNYISSGFSGKNIFTANKGANIKSQKVIAISHDLKWGKSGNNTVELLPKLDI